MDWLQRRVAATCDVKVSCDDVTSLSPINRPAVGKPKGSKPRDTGQEE